MRRQKHTLLVFILLITPMITTVLTTRVAKASGIAVSVEPLTIYDTSMVPDTEFSVDITVNYVEKLWAYQFWLKFNPEVLQGVSVENGPFLGSAGGDVWTVPGPGFDNEAGQLKIFGAFIYFENVLPEHKLPIGGGVLATVTFKVVGYGSSTIKLGPETRLSNKTGGPQFDDEWCYGWHPTPKEPPHYGIPIPWEPWLNSLGHGSFDNRPLGLHVSPSEVKGVKPHENFTINLDVVNMTDFYQWEFYMSWNATLLNVTSVAEGDFLKSQPEGTIFAYEIHNDEGYVRVNCTTTGEHPGVGGGGTVANVTFTVLHRGTCSLDLYNASILDSKGDLMDFRTVDGFFINLEFHDIAVASVEVYPTRVEAGTGDLVSIDVTVENRGDFKETGINVTAYYGESEIRTERDISLDNGTETTLTFIWNTTGVRRGKYIITATASPVTNETSTADNTKRGGEVSIHGHDIAIAEVTTYVGHVYQGLNTTIRVVVKNEGTELETFNVTAYYGDEEAGTRTVYDLGYLASVTLLFTWETTGVELGTYAISASTSVIEGEKTEDLADNTFVKEDLVEVVPLEVTVLPMEVFVLPIVVVAIAAGAWVFFRGRKKPFGEV